MVGDDHADGVDVGGGGDGLPVVLRPLVAVALGGVIGDGLVHVGDGDQPHVRPIGAEKSCGVAVSGSMGTSGHAAADYRDTD
jgi:hypothetical protein